MKSKLIENLFLCDEGKIKDYLIDKVETFITNMYRKGYKVLSKVPHEEIIKLAQELKVDAKTALDYVRQMTVNGKLEDYNKLF